VGKEPFWSFVEKYCNTKHPEKAKETKLTGKCKIKEKLHDIKEWLQGGTIYELLQFI